MLHMIGHMIFGLIIGIIAKFIMPGPNPGGIIVTMLLGIAGAWIGGFLGRSLGLYKEGHPAGFFMALIGAIVLLFIYHLAAR
ncbi:MAG: GlsB/YeaQ/YmgE family stress response membrane protein [Bryobacteraceae bacterium]